MQRTVLRTGFQLLVVAVLGTHGAAQAAAPTPNNIRWVNVGGNVKDIGVGVADMQASAPTAKVIAAGGETTVGGHHIYALDGTPSAWKEIGGLAVATDLAIDGEAWVANEAGAIFRRTAGNWEHVEGCAKDLAGSAFGGKVLYAIGCEAGPGGFNILARGGNWANGFGTTWRTLPGRAVHIDVESSGRPWVVNENGSIFRSNDTVTDWEHIPGSAKDIGGGGAVWIIGSTPVPASNDFYAERWNPGSRTWERSNAGGVRISVDTEGRPWVVTHGGHVLVGVEAKTTFLPPGEGTVGCYADTAARDLDGHIEQVSNLTPVKCKDICGRKGFKYAGLQAATWCACGNSFGKHGRAGNCDTACSGDARESCGGTWANEVFDIGPKGPGRRVEASVLGAVEDRTPKYVPMGAETPAGSTPPSTSLAGDPIWIAAERFPAAKAFLEPLEGIFHLESIESKSSEDRTQVFKFTGKLDWTKGVGALNHAPTNGHNNPFHDLHDKRVVPTGLKRGASIATSSHKVLMGALVKNVAAIAEKVGVSNPMPLEVTLYNKNAEYDLEVTYPLATAFHSIGKIVPTVGTELALRGVNLKLHAKMNQGTLGRSVTAELEGKLFVKPTAHDPWLGVTPVVEPDHEGTVEFGGDITGACSGTPTASTDPATCTGVWDVFQLGVLKATGGVLKLAVKGGALEGVEAAIQNGKLGPSGVPVDGAVLVDADMSPGAGVVVNTKGSPSFKDALAMYRAFGTKVAPVGQLFAGIDAMPNPNIPASQDSQVIIAPTGLTVGHIDVTQPTIFSDIKASVVGVDVEVKADIKADPEKILVKQDWSGRPKGYLESRAKFDEINRVINQVPLVKELFVLKDVSSKVEVDGPTHTGKGAVAFTLFGKAKQVSVPLVSANDPNAIIAVLKGLLELKCREGLEQGGALCYPPCKAGYTSDGATLCKKPCPSDYREEPLTCMRDAHIFGNGCKGGCPGGYTNDGCTCRRDPHSISREHYSRGAGEVMKSVLLE